LNAYIVAIAKIQAASDHYGLALRRMQYLKNKHKDKFIKNGDGAW